MSNQFYSYLSNRILQYFNNSNLKNGDKYYIRFENDDQVDFLYQELKSNTISIPFTYSDQALNEVYSTYVLQFKNTELLVASTSNNVHPDFLTTLRNLVGVEGEYKNKALLFIHASSLDSLIGGAGSFHSEGMPLSINEIEKDIRNKVANSNFSSTDQAILNLYLENKRKELRGANISVFEFEEVLSIIEQSKIELFEYEKFGLFPDKKLSEYNANKLKQRLQENNQFYRIVEEIHNYNDMDKLEKHVDDKGVLILRRPEWSKVPYEEVEKFIENKKIKTVIEYSPIIQHSSIWDRGDGETKSKERKRNIIIFNEDKKDEFEFDLTFTEFTKKENIKHCTSSSCESLGKKIKVKLFNFSDNATFHAIKYDDGATKFQFKIVVINFNKHYLESIKTNYSVVLKKNRDDCGIVINTDSNKFILNEFGDTENNVVVREKNQVILIDNSKTFVSVSDDYQYTDDEDLVKFSLLVDGCKLTMFKKGDAEKIKVIDGLKLWKLKRDYRTNFEYLGENKLQHGTKAYFTRDEFRKNLEREQAFLSSGELGLFEEETGLTSMNLQVAENLQVAFNRIVDYFIINNTLPSLAYLNNELETLYKDYLKLTLDLIGSWESGDYLSKSQKDIFYIGMIKRNVGDEEILLTPLHIINIAYQLKINNIDTSCIEDEETDLMRKFQHLYLLPYISIDPYTKERVKFIPVEQSHSPEWKIYVDEKIPRYKGSKEYVIKLVAEKIEEFTGHFNYLFNIGSKTQLKINLINTGDNLEILQGIFKYFIKTLKNTTQDIIPICVHIYSNMESINYFEEFTQMNDIDMIEKNFNINLEVDNLSKDEVVDKFRENIEVYLKPVDACYDFGHLTFVEMIDDSALTVTSMDDIPTGVAMDGIMSSVPSVLLQDTYRTGFGIGYARQNSDLMDIAISLNSINAAINGNQYLDRNCNAYSISNLSQKNLDKVYDASNWVTFINPKVDLNFFTNNTNSKELLIIHYSDQYNTTSSGFDAITVTKKSRQYQNVIEDYLMKNGVVNASEKTPEIINMFNAINGDWLLRLLSTKSYFSKEKLSILSAVKYAVKRFSDANTIWVPISLEEILRISGGVGLRQKDSLFSAKNLGFDNSGATSDDILLIGIKKGAKVQVTFYPVEVKIGINSTNYIQKGIEQAKHTKNIFNQVLKLGEAKDGNIKLRIFRNFFMQLAISSAEKLLIYSVGNGNQGWDDIVHSELRTSLLNEEYQIVENFSEDMGSACIISFKKDNVTATEKIDDGVLVIEKSEKDGVNILTQSISDIQIGNSDIEPLNNLEFDVFDEIEKNEKNDNFDEDIIREKQYEANSLGAVVETVQPTLDNDYSEILLDTPTPIQTKISAESPLEVKVPEVATVEKTEDIIPKTINRNIEIVFGEIQDIKKPLVWYPNDSTKVLHTNTGIIGTMGTGKTQFTKSLITQLHNDEKYNLNGKPLGILIFDYKGDYNKSKTDFLDATGAKVYNLENLPFNPLSITLSENSKPRLPIHIANALKETITKVFGLGIKQETLLRDIIKEAYADKGISIEDSSTWTRQAPTLNDVYELYIQREDLKEDSLYAAFSNLIDFQIFEPDGSKTKSLFDLIEGVTVIDLSGYDTGIQNLVVSITLDLFYTQMQAYGHSSIDGNIRQLNKIVLVDEADNFLSQNFSSLKKILKEGREFGVGTILSTQLLSHFSTSDTEYANYILTWVIHNVSDLSTKDIKYIFNTQSKSEEEYLFSRIKSLEKHHSIVKMGGSTHPIKIKDYAFWELVQNKDN